MEKQKFIIFDFFGVICSEIAPYWLREHFSDDMANIIKADIVSKADVGKITQDKMFNELSKKTGVSSKQIQKEWNELIKIDYEVIKFIGSIRNKYRIALLTNSPDKFVRDILDKHELNDLFELVIVSAEEKMAKPNNEIYELLLSQANEKARNSIMIDDNILNIKGAQSIGIQGIHYENFATFKQEFDLITKQ